jgi:cell division protein FtsB
MAKRKSQLERAIESLEADRAVIDAAIAKLKQQQPKPARVPVVRDVALTTRREPDGTR